MSNYGQGLGGCGSSGGGSCGGGSGVAASAAADSPDNFSLPYPCLLPTFFPLIPWPLPTSSFQSPWLMPFVTSSGIHIFFNTKMGVAECVAKVVRVVCLELIAFFMRANSTALEDFARGSRRPDAVIDEQVVLKCVENKFRPKHTNRLAFARSLCNNASPGKEELNDLVACVLMFLAARNAGAHCDLASAQHEPGSPNDACETELRFVLLCNQVLNEHHLDYAVARKLAYKINSFEAEAARADGTTHVGLLPLHLCNIGAAIFNTLGANNSHDIMLALQHRLHCGLAELA
jgi:hypothetical protein